MPHPDLSAVSTLGSAGGAGPCGRGRAGGMSRGGFLRADVAVCGAAGNGAAAGNCQDRRCPAYRVEPPDLLSIEMLKQIPLPPYRVDIYDVLQIRVMGTLPDQPIDGYFLVEAEGIVTLGPTYGRVRVAGMTIEEATEAITQATQPHLVTSGCLGAIGAHGRHRRRSPATIWSAPTARST